MHPDDITTPSLDETMPAPPIDPQRAVVSAMAPLPVKEGAHRETDVIIAPDSPFANSTIRKASDIAYTGASGLILLIVAAAVVTMLVWFISDLRGISAITIPPGVNHTQFERGQVINAVINLLANLVLVFILIEVFTAVVNFVRTRRATARPILLIPLYIIMRAIVVIGGQLVFNPPPSDTELFIKVLAELAVFSVVGLALSIALAVLRDPTPQRPKAEDGGRFLAHLAVSLGERAVENRASPPAGEGGCGRFPNVIMLDHRPLGLGIASEGKLTFDQFPSRRCGFARLFPRDLATLARRRAGAVFNRPPRLAPAQRGAPVG